METSNRDAAKRRSSYVDICEACSVLTLEALVKAPSIGLLCNIGGLGAEEYGEAIASNPPIRLDAAHILSTNMCSMCRLLKQHLVKAAPELDDSIDVYSCKDLGGGLQSLWLYAVEPDLPKISKTLASPTSNTDSARVEQEPVLKLKLFADGSNALASEHLPYRRIVGHGTNAGIRHIKKWIATCNESHTRCCYTLSGSVVHQESPLPTRVINVGLALEPVRLVSSKKMTASYVALSHCWGGNSNYSTTTKNLEEHMRSLDPTRLSKTVREAIFVVRKLGLKYLWVDSLCILQDDSLDWKREASQMAGVYENAYLVLDWKMTKQSAPYSFLCSLLWHAEAGCSLRKPLQIQAPSWSWAALDGPLDFADKVPGGGECSLSMYFLHEETNMRILKVQVYQPLGRNSLVLSSVLIPVSQISHHPESNARRRRKCWACERMSDQPCVRLSVDSGYELEGSFMFDQADVESAKLWLLPIYPRHLTEDMTVPPIHYVLLVSEVPGQAKSGFVFERVGMGHIEDARFVYQCKRQFVVLV